MKQVISKMIMIINCIVEIAFIVFIILFCLITVSQKFLRNSSFFGYRIFTIITNSMEPELKVGDVILVKEKPVDEIKRGDNITYLGMSDELKGKIITHQVKNYIEENGNKIFYTQGVNSDTTDPAVYPSQIYGAVEYRFALLSSIHRLITSFWGFILLIILPLSYILVMEIRTIILEKQRAQKKNKNLEKTMEII